MVKLTKKQKNTIKQYTQIQYLMVYGLILLTAIIFFMSIEMSRNDGYKQGYEKAQEEHEIEKIVNMYQELGLLESFKLFLIILLVKTPDIIIYVILVAPPIAWMIHGFGFIVVKR